MTDQTEREKFIAVMMADFKFSRKSAEDSWGRDTGTAQIWKSARTIDGGKVSLPTGYAITERPYDYCLSKDGYSLLVVVKGNHRTQSFNKHLFEFFRALHDAQQENRG